MRVGQARKRDLNEKPIRKALEAAGAHVTQISGKGAPDLLVRYQGHLWAFEVKNPDGFNHVETAQAVTAWPIIRTVDEALKAIGVCR